MYRNKKKKLRSTPLFWKLLADAHHEIMLGTAQKNTLF